MGFKVVLALEYVGTHLDEKPLKDVGAQLTIIPCHGEDEIIAAAHDADAVITVPLTRSFSRRVIESLSKCRIISAPGIGYDGIDLDAATERGICVTNVPDYCLEEVSDHTMALILACARKLFRLDKAVREGKWDTLERPRICYDIWPPMFRIRGQTLGLIGFGNVARALVPKAQGFGLRIIAFSPHVGDDVVAGLGVEPVDMDQLLRESDYVSVHTALNAGTRHMLGLEQFRKMKRTAYLINTARGGLIGERALYTALSEGYIAGTGLDVMEFEPPSLDNPLFKLDNVIFTAHTAHYSDTSALELLRRPVEEVVRALGGELPHNLVNPEVKESFILKWGKG